MFWSNVLFLILILNQNSGWNKYNAKDGSFTIMMPDKVVEKTVTAQTPVGILEYRVNYAELRDTSEANFLFAVNYCDYPVYLADSIDLSEELFTSTIEEHLEQVKGELIYESNDITYGVQGKVWRIHYNQGRYVLRCRAFVHKNRFYALQTFGLNRTTNEHSDRFFNSFILTKS